MKQDFLEAELLLVLIQGDVITASGNDEDPDETEKQPW